MQQYPKHLCCLQPPPPPPTHTHTHIQPLVYIPWCGRRKSVHSTHLFHSPALDSQWLPLPSLKICFLDTADSALHDAFLSCLPSLIPGQAPSHTFLPAIWVGGYHMCPALRPSLCLLPNPPHTPKKCPFNLQLKHHHYQKPSWTSLDRDSHITLCGSHSTLFGPELQDDAISIIMYVLSPQDINCGQELRLRVYQSRDQAPDPSVTNLAPLYKTHLSVSFHLYKIVVMIKDLLYQLVMRIKWVNEINHIAWYIVSSYSTLTHSGLLWDLNFLSHRTITTFI